MLRIFLLLATVVLIQATEKFFEKYTFAKTMSQCFGSSAYQNYLLRIAEAKRDCGYQGYRPFQPYRPNYSPTFNPTYNPTYNPSFNTERPFFNPSTIRPDYPSFASTIRPDYPSFTSTSRSFFTRATSPPINVVIPGRDSSYPGRPFEPFTPAINMDDFFRSYGIGKQGVRFYENDNQLYDGGAVREAVERVGLALQNFTCVLTRLDLIDRALNVNYDMINNNYYQSSLDGQLRNDLVEGVNYCRQMNSCLPEDKSPISYEMQRMIAFIKCERRTRLAACFKHDLRRSIHQFDVSALPDDGNLSTDLEKLMTIIIGSESLDELELI